MSCWADLEMGFLARARYKLTIVEETFSSVFFQD